MFTFLLTLAITFTLLLGASLLISFCKRRQAGSNHGLTGMCHQNGGRMCGSCDASMLAKGRRPRPTSTGVLSADGCQEKLPAGKMLPGRKA